MANSSPSEEHVDATEAIAAGQDAWSEDYYWDSNYGCWVYFEQWITSMSRGTILYMTVGTYGLANNAMESPQIFQSLA